ncbi:helix-turn-helix domain-containing protein [Streptococcus pluranimalium]|uniref:helix-turn-helix domain-containing protein n=1 Tax=Streptococcus pluranimalium TaxID=82348 RepID=UPI003F681935
MNRLKELRKEKKLTQEELASEIGVSKITILRWENDERQIKPDKTQALADYFGVSVGYLLGYSDTPELIKAMIPHSVLDEDGNPTLIEEIQQSVFTTDKDDELIRVGHIKALSIVPGNIEKHLNGDPKNIYRMMAVAPTDYQSIIMLWAIMTPEQRKATLTLLQTFNFEDKN